MPVRRRTPTPSVRDHARRPRRRHRQAQRGRTDDSGSNPECHTAIPGPDRRAMRRTAEGCAMAGGRACGPVRTGACGHPASRGRGVRGRCCRAVDTASTEAPEGWTGGCTGERGRDPDTASAGRTAVRPAAVAHSGDRAVPGRKGRSGPYLSVAEVSPAWTWRWKERYTTSMGIIAIVTPAKRTGRSVAYPCCCWSWMSPWVRT